MDPCGRDVSEGQAVDDSHSQSHSAGRVDTPHSPTSALPALCHAHNFSHEFHYVTGTNSDWLCLIRLTVGGLGAHVLSPA